MMTSTLLRKLYKTTQGCLWKTQGYQGKPLKSQNVLQLADIMHYVQTYKAFCFMRLLSCLKSVKCQNIHQTSELSRSNALFYP